MIDKRDTQQILGCLMKQPQLLSKIDKYSFVLTDFPSRFERSIFMAINGLYRNGATKIQPIDIENIALFFYKSKIHIFINLLEKKEITDFQERIKKRNIYDKIGVK